MRTERCAARRGRAALGLPGAGLAAAAALGLTACTPALPRAATTQGQRIYDLWILFFLTALGVAGVVCGLIVWCIVRYRRRGDELPPQYRDNVPIEIVYTVVPIGIVAFLFAATYPTEMRVDLLAPRPDVTINVTAFKWSWLFDYAGTGVRVTGTPDFPPVALVPAGRTVRIVLTSTDVVHSFYVPSFLYKRDATPGLLQRFDMRVRTPGDYLGECVEFCGFDHARMRFWLEAVTPAAFDRWIRQGPRTVTQQQRETLP
jgi:cytochrome c oxidase subunit 2